MDEDGPTSLRSSPMCSLVSLLNFPFRSGVVDAHLLDAAMGATTVERDEDAIGISAGAFRGRAGRVAVLRMEPMDRRRDMSGGVQREECCPR